MVAGTAILRLGYCKAIDRRMKQDLASEWTGLTSLTTGESWGTP